MKRGFTLIELLVVITIIGIMVGLTLVAVSAGREAARRTQCQNNARQVCVGLRSYELASRTFPPSVVGGKSWVIKLLPFIEQKGMDKTVVIPILLCPTDSFNTIKYHDSLARCNYAANGGMCFLKDDELLKWRTPKICGVMGKDKALSSSEIKDGTAKTILIGELRAGISNIDCRGTWGMTGACPNSLWAHGYTSDDNGPNAKSDDLINCTDVKFECSPDNWPNWQQTSKSLHPSGVNVGFADGHVDFIDNDIELGTPQQLGLWDKLNLSNDGEK